MMNFWHLSAFSLDLGLAAGQWFQQSISLMLIFAVQDE